MMIQLTRITKPQGTTRLGLKGFECLLSPRFRQFSSSHACTSQMNPIIPNDDHLYKIRKPGRVLADPIHPGFRLGQNPLYKSPYDNYVGLAKRWSFGVVGVLAYAGYLALEVTGVSPLIYAGGFAAASSPIFALQYFTGPHVARIFRLYKRDEPQTYENLTKDETLVIEQIGFLGRSTKATEVRLQDITIVNERLGWVNWKHTDPVSGEELALYVCDNIGGLKMDRIWGVIEKNSGLDNGRSFLDEPDA